MATRTEVEDPLVVDTFKADSRGRVRLGKEFADQNVRIVVDEIVKEDN